MKDKATLLVFAIVLSLSLVVAFTQTAFDEPSYLALSQGNITFINTTSNTITQNSLDYNYSGNSSNGALGVDGDNSSCATMNHSSSFWENFTLSTTNRTVNITLRTRIGKSGVGSIVTWNCFNGSEFIELLQRNMTTTSVTIGVGITPECLAVTDNILQFKTDFSIPDENTTRLLYCDAWIKGIDAEPVIASVILPAGTIVTSARINLTGIARDDVIPLMGFNYTGQAPFIGSIELATDGDFSTKWDMQCGSVANCTVNTTEVIASPRGTFTTASWNSKFRSDAIVNPRTTNITCLNFSSSEYIQIGTFTIGSPLTIVERNDTIHNDCLGATEVVIKTLFPETDNTLANIEYFEGRLFLDSQNPNPVDPYLAVEGSRIWNFTGNFTQTNNRTDDFSAIIRDSCGNPVASDCNVTFDFYSGTRGRILFLDLLIESDGVVENTDTFNESVFETSRENFEVNVSYDTALYSGISANLFYNGTSYLGTRSQSGSHVVFSRNLDIPEVSSNVVENKSFYWEVSLSNTTGTFKFNTTENNQTVSPLFFQLCNATFNAPVFVNYTIIDEETKASLNAVMDAVFFYSIGGTIFKNYTLDTATAIDSYGFCTDNNETYIVDVDIDLSAPSYTTRNFFFNDEIYSNATTYLNLTLLESGNGTNVIVQLVDTGLQPFVGYFIEFQRHYPENNEHKMVIKERTDEFGQFVARLIENTVEYKVIVSNPNNVVIKTIPVLKVGCHTAICVLQIVVEDTTDYFERYENITDFESTIAFDNATNIVTATWNDATGDSITMRFLVERVLINGTTILCNDSLTSLSNSLSCDTQGITGNYRAQLFRRVIGGNELRCKDCILSWKIGDTAAIYGREGLIWAFLLLFTLIGIGSFNPTLGGILYGIGFIGLGAIGIVPLNAITLIANLVIVIVFVWAFRG
jgi:hypothetical protein